MAKEEKEEKGILDTMGDAFATAGEYLSDKLSGRDFTEEGLKKMKEKAEKEKQKEKPKKVTAKPKAKPQRVSQRTQVSASPSGAQFNTVTETDNSTKKAKAGPITLINTDKVESSIARLKELQKRLKND